MKTIFGIVVIGALSGAIWQGRSPEADSCCPPASHLLLSQAGSQVPAYRNAEGKLWCPVMNVAIASEAKASGYSDYKGVRYYFCCAGCKPAFDKNPAKYVANLPAPKAPKQGTEPQVLQTKVGKYVVEIWPPDEGLYAGEEVDVEFGVFDSTKEDKRLGGMVGVPDVQVSAVVTMPSMPGMPEQKPNVHKEGRDGVHGLELYFPHGGDYQIDLTLTPKGEKPIKATFKVDVGDERPTDAPRKAPYELQVIDFPKVAKAGEPVDLRMRVIDTKTGQPETNFEIVHEQLFHLLMASRDLSRFMHEHPTMAPDGTWTYRATFPTGGEYWIYGDVAPKGKGSRILITKVNVAGGEAPSVRLVPHSGPSSDGGLTGVIEPVEGSIPIGKMTLLRVGLTDAQTGQPAGDTEKWLGAAGHLMIFHEDGQTVVHSHPKEDEENEALVKKGEVVFTARFPKPGLYKAYAQFQRHGQIKTLGFVLDVKAAQEGS